MHLRLLRNQEREPNPSSKLCKRTLTRWSLLHQLDWMRVRLLASQRRLRRELRTRLKLAKVKVQQALTAMAAAMETEVVVVVAKYQ
jgi:hypothetical protein